MATKPFTVDGNIVVDEATLSNSTNSLVLPAGSIITGGGIILDATNSDTDDLVEGTANLYFTDARADARITLQAGANLDLSSKTTTDLAEGTNLYYTDARADARITVASIDALVDVDTTTSAPTSGQALIWDNANSKFIPGDSFSQSDFDSAFTAKDTDALSEGSTNLYYTDARADARIAAASITDLSDADQSVQTTDNVTFANITTSGYLRGPASFVIDPAAFNDDTGTVVIAGNLQVDGVQTTINSTTVEIDDLNFTIASAAADSAAANGAGITVGGAGATLNYTHATTSWDMNKPLNITGNLGVSGTVDGVDIAARDAVLTSTTTTANNALPKTGGTITGDLALDDNVKAIFGADSDLKIYSNGINGFIENNTGLLILKNNSDNRDVAIQSDDGTGGIANYLLADGSAGALNAYHYGNLKLATTSTGIDVTGNVTVSGTVDGVDIAARDAILTSTTTTAGAALPKAGGTITGAISLEDNVSLNLGDGNDASLVFDGTDTTLTTAGELILDAGTGITIDGNSVTNQYALVFSNMGAGTGGIYMRMSSGGTLQFGNRMDHPRVTAIEGVNKSLAYVVQGSLGDSNYAAHDFVIDANASSQHPAVMGVRSPNNNALLIQGEQSDSTVVFSVDYDGNIATSGTLDVEDLNITVASGAVDAASANGAGLTVAGANATITYDSTNDEWDLNKDINVTGSVRASQPFFTNSQTVTEDHTVATGESAMAAGPVTVNSGVTVTVSSGSRWVIV